MKASSQHVQQESQSTGNDSALLTKREGIAGTGGKPQSCGMMVPTTIIVWRGRVPGSPSCVEWSWCGTFVLAHALALVLGVGQGDSGSGSGSGGCCR